MRFTASPDEQEAARRELSFLQLDHFSNVALDQLILRSWDILLERSSAQVRSEVHQALRADGAPTSVAVYLVNMADTPATAIHPSNVRTLLPGTDEQVRGDVGQAIAEAVAPSRFATMRALESPCHDDIFLLQANSPNAPVVDGAIISPGSQVRWRPNLDTDLPATVTGISAGNDHAYLALPGDQHAVAPLGQLSCADTTRV